MAGDVGTGAGLDAAAPPRFDRDSNGFIGSDRVLFLLLSLFFACYSLFK